MDLSMENVTYQEEESSSAQSKRANKPLVERKRRVRINKSIEELKAIVLQAMNKDDKDYCKMEKADILEMVVRHLRAIRRSQLSAESIRDPGPVWNNYRAGFNECAAEVMTYMRDIDGVDHSMQLRMLQHISSCVQHVNTYPSDVPNPAQNVINYRAPAIATVPQDIKSQFLQQKTRQQPPQQPVVVAPVLRIPSTTPESSLPGSSMLPIKQEVMSVPSHEKRLAQRHSPVNFSANKGRYSTPPVDQIVPGSQSPEVDYYATENLSMVTEMKDTRRSPVLMYEPQKPTTNDYFRQHELKFKMKHTAKPSYSMHRERSSVHPNYANVPSTNSVWRPW